MTFQEEGSRCATQKKCCGRTECPLLPKSQVFDGILLSSCPFLFTGSGLVPRCRLSSFACHLTLSALLKMLEMLERKGDSNSILAALASCEWMVAQLVMMVAQLVIMTFVRLPRFRPAAMGLGASRRLSDHDGIDIPGPQMPGTGGTLGVVGKDHWDRARQRRVRFAVSHPKRKRRT